MDRILVVDDDESIRLIVQEALGDYELRIAEKPSLALEFARKESFRLVISDVNMPEMNGFWFCKQLRKLPGSENVPFLFISGADAQAELDIARSLGVERILLKPFDLDDLLRAVRVGLGEAHSEKGEVTNVLDSILAEVASGRETGILTTVDGRMHKRFVLRKGFLVLAMSNDPRDLIGQALLRAGVISEHDLRLALASGQRVGDGKPASSLKSILTSMRKLTPDQCEKVFVRKVRESLLDVFLWDKGVAEFMAGTVEGAEESFPLAIDLSSLSLEGSRRRDRWKSVRKILPAPDLQIERAGGWPAGFPKDAGDHLLAKQIDRGLNLEEIFTELRGQRFAVGVKLAQFLTAGIVRAVDPVGFTGSASPESSPEEIERARLELELSEKLGQVTARSAEPTPKAPKAPPKPAPAKPVPKLRAANATKPARPAPAVEAPFATPAPSVKTEILTRGLLRFRSGDLAGAREAFTDVLSIDPMNELARRRLREVDEAFEKLARGAGLGSDRRVRIAMPISKMVGQKNSSTENFLLSRLVKGPCSIQDLVVVCPAPEADVLTAIGRFLATGILVDAE